MIHATAKDLRFHTRQLLDCIARGEDILINYRGRPCAKMTPASETIPNESIEAKTAAFGMWRDHPKMKDVAHYLRNLRESRFTC